jgi:hypothetical protein
MGINFDEVLTSFERERVQSLTRDRSRLGEECVLAARRGWDACSPRTAWPTTAEDAVRAYFRDELTDDVLDTHEHGGGAARWALFASYAIGWVFALQKRGRLDEGGAQTAFAILPGFMWMHEDRIAGPSSTME